MGCASDGASSSSEFNLICFVYLSNRTESPQDLSALRLLQERLGAYTEHDVEELNLALQEFELCRLGRACRDRVDALRACGDPKHIRNESCEDMTPVQTDKATFLILAYSCCVNHSQWFVKHESRRLITLVSDLTLSQKIALLRIFHIEVRSDDADSLLLCVDFEHATELVAKRSVLVRNGTAYLQHGQLTYVIREAYEARLSVFVKKCKIRIEEIGKTNTAYYAPQYATVLNIMHDLQFYVCPVVSPEFAGIECSARTLPAAVAQFAPLCIVKLVLKLKVRRHLIDKERVTLRLWLRAVQVKLDVAVEFWSQHVQEKEDVRGPIAQAYAKQYACVGCAKIRAQGLCPFEDTNKTMLSWCTEIIPSAVPDIEDILHSTPCPLERCGRVFALRHGGRLAGPRNPANYFARASESGLR